MSLKHRRSPIDPLLTYGFAESRHRGERPLSGKPEFGD